MSGPLALSLVVTQLAGTSGIVDVGGASEFIAAREALKRSPSAFVLPAKDTAGANELVTQIDQRVIARFGVMLAVKNLRDAQGVAALNDLTPLRRAVWAKLLGWAPADEFAPCTYAGGRLFDFDLDNQVLWWVDEFDTDYYVKVV